MNKHSKVIKIFSECISMEGYARAIIYDLGRRDFKFIPNELHRLLLKCENKSKEYLYTNTKYSTEDTKRISEYISFLDENDFIFYCDDDEINLFPKLELNWDYPAIISNIIIDDLINNITINSIISLTNCQNLTLNYFDKIKFKDIHDVVTAFDESKIQCIDIFINYQNNSHLYELIKKTIKSYKRVRSVVFFNAPRINSNSITSFFGNILFVRENLTHKFFQIKKSQFTINIDLFTESQSHHTYFNRKLYIRKDGEIKNAPECEESFGYIQDYDTPEKIKEIVESPEFQKYWFVHKEILDVCKDCEFRHMCVDNRLPYKRKENEWYHKIECNYNPYIAKWEGEEGYQTLAECGGISNEEGFSIDHNKIAEINAELWSE